jgi:hypothetical protein
MARSLRSLYGSLALLALWRMACSLRSLYGKTFFYLPSSECNERAIKRSGL